MIRLAMAGAAGRMGRAILGAALKDPEFKISGALEQAGHPDLDKDLGGLLASSGIRVSSDLAAVLKQTDVLIDFTHPSAAAAHLRAAEQAKVGLVIGTTGLEAPILEEINRTAQRIAIVQSPNMSLGVNLLFKLCELAAGALDESYDIEIAEIHHRQKKDAPSGTAMKLLEILAAARGRQVSKDVVYGREGEVGARPRGEIGVSALRGGDVVGDHTVSFFGDAERVELVHKASSREAFALGAVRAAKFVASRKTGLYTMQHVLGL